MAEANSSRCCVSCGNHVEQSGARRGRPRQYCDRCRDKGVDPTPGECRLCGSHFLGRPDRQYCSPKCRLKSKRQRTPDKRRPIRVACHGCGITVERPGRSIGNGFAGLYCTRECCYASMGRVAAETAALRRIASRDSAKLKRRRKASVVAIEAAALRRIASYVERPRTFRSECKSCGASIVVRRNGGLHKTTCDACLAESVKRARRTAKAKRRAVTRGRKAESIDPIKVFERDGWRCQLCGVRTPKRLRGTYEDRAPELDHVVALADGGTHTWGNVQCACRRCNGTKGAESRGQLGLPFAA